MTLKETFARNQETAFIIRDNITPKKTKISGKQNGLEEPHTVQLGRWHANRPRRTQRT